MSVVAGGVASPTTPKFIGLGFRPFFVAAGLWSAAALAAWIVMFVTGAALPSRLDPLAGFAMT